MVCKWNKALENKEIEVKKISKHHDHHGTRNSKPPKWFTDYMEKFEEKIDQKIYNAFNNPPKPPKWFTDYMDKFAKINNLKLTDEN